MKDGERERPIENYGKKEQRESLDNMLPDPHPCTAGKKEEEHNIVYLITLYSGIRGGPPRDRRTHVTSASKVKTC